MRRHPKVRGPGYIVREGQVRGRGRYLCCLSDAREPFYWRPSAAGCDRGARRTAERSAKSAGGRVVRILSHEEAKRKAKAAGLRELAEEMRADMKYWPPFDVSRDVIKKMARKAEEKADALWPRKGAGR